jgi:hypothetical protein
VSSSLQDTDTRKTRGTERGTETTRPVPFIVPSRQEEEHPGYPVPGGTAPIVRVWVNPASGCGSTLRQGEGHSASG